MPKKVYKKKVPVKKTRVAKKKGFTKLVIKNVNHKPIPDQLIDKFNFIFHGSAVTAGNGATQDWMINVNTLLVAANSSVLNAGINTGNKWTSSAPGGGGCFDVTVASFPEGLQSFISPSTANIGLYSRYTVYGFSYKIAFQPQATADNCYVVVTPQNLLAVNSANLYNTPTEAENAPFSKSKLISINNSIAQNTIKGYVDVAKFLGVTRNQLMTDTGYSGYIFASGIILPAYIVNLNVLLRQMNNVGFTNNVPYRVDFEYYVSFRQAQGKLMSD